MTRRASGTWYPIAPAIRLVCLRFGQIPSVMPRFLPAIVHGFPGQMIQGVPQKVHIAALPDRLRDHFGNGAFGSRVIMQDHKLHPPLTPGF